MASRLIETNQQSGEILEITVRLEGEVRDHFLKIKQAKGIKNNTDTLRLMINEYWKRLVKGA